MEELRKDILQIKEKLETPAKKDSWDKFKIIGSILLPLAIFYVGRVFSHAQMMAQQHSAEKIALL